VVPKSNAEGIDSGQLKKPRGLLQLGTDEELLHGRVLPLLLTAQQLLAAVALLVRLGLHVVPCLGNVVAQCQTPHL